MKYLIYFLALLILLLATNKILAQALRTHIVIAPIVATSTPPIAPIKQAVVRQVKRREPTPTQIALANKVREVFDEEMVDVIRCESQFNQHKSNGTPLLSPTSDVGVMQINQVHWKRAKALGLDIFNSVDDNIIMGKIVYDEREKLTGNGAEAWSCYAIILARR